MDALIISCEHAVNTIPSEYELLFSSSHHLLNSHAGIDFGALSIAQYLQNHFQCPMVEATASRLLIDCNRSLRHPYCFSELTNALPQEQKNSIIAHYYTPFHQRVTALIESAIQAKQQVLHLSIHSFTPILNGVTRQADIGLLYDPKRHDERLLATRWQQELKAMAPQYRVRKNYPYLGISDGFTSSLRKIYPATSYIGIELESNQALTTQEQSLNILKKILTLCLSNLI